MNIRRKHIRELAFQLIGTEGIHAAPIDVKRIAEAQNAVVHETPTEDKFAGYLFRDTPGGVAIIGVNSKHSPTRRRFTIAHEVGHLLLHASNDSEPVHFDEIFMRRDPRSAEGTDPKEMEANLFAAELLMPTHFLKRDVPEKMLALRDEETVIEHLAKQYNVSAHAMGIRLSYLGYIT